MNSKYSVEDLLDESAIFLHTFLLLDKNLLKNPSRDD